MSEALRAVVICPCCGQVTTTLPQAGTAGFGARVRMARMKCGITQGELGQRLMRKRTHAAISELETGKVRIKLDEVDDIARALCVDVGWLVGYPTE